MHITVIARAIRSGVP